MTTTLEIPEDLLREIAQRAQRNGREFRDEVVNVLRTGLTATSPLAPITMEISPITGLLVVRCPPDAPARSMTAEELIAIEREALESEDIERFGLPH